MKRKFTSAIIVAAGSSTRMGKNKMLLELGGKTVLERSVEAFEINANTDEIIVAASKDNLEIYSELLRGFSKVKAVVLGGETRQQSVARAIAATSEETEFVAVHDGARPLVEQDTINETLAAAYEYGAAACAVKVKDTIKITDEGGFVLGTPERETLRAIHTPQCFEKKAYLEALAELGENVKNMTDDCSLFEKCGKKIKITQSKYSNIKITTAEDIPMATSLMKGE